MLTRQNDNDDFFRGLMNYKYRSEFKQGGFVIHNLQQYRHLIRKEFEKGHIWGNVFYVITFRVFLQNFVI